MPELARAHKKTADMDDLRYSPDDCVSDDCGSVDPDEKLS